MGKINYDLGGKVFVVTGGSRGIGLELARHLLGQQVKVAICGRKQEGLQAAADELNAGDNLLCVQAHVAKADDVEDLFQRVTDQFGKIDGLINNVGMNIATGLVDADPGLWNKIIDSNLNGSFLCSRKAGQLMREQNGGKIVSISSIAGRRSAPFMGIYGVAKAAIEMMTKVLAQELAAFNIQVNAVAPCMVRTKFSEPFWSNTEIHDQIIKTIPMGRIAEPADVVHPTLFLCSEAANFITGQTILVDGGASAI
ncbi:MAG: SDR family oxidoreductase [Deltaproteobacteria bacterium]|jgi:2-deoxy-D-gluconate 3-dehydrogenase|nr:SDR family oxidoreductase [Deltaproteobacteria bacterium]